MAAPIAVSTIANITAPCAEPCGFRCFAPTSTRAVADPRFVFSITIPKKSANGNPGVGWLVIRTPSLTRR